MGLSGRDPIFFAQLASEIETFHPESSTLIQDTCMSCHAVQGHRQHAIDRFAQSSACDPLARAALDAVPYPPGNPTAGLAHYAALGRDGVSCTTCHSMVLGADATEKVKDAPQNACVKARQELINPGLTGLAKTFTGNFLVANPGEIFGPFKDPKKKPMEHATGLVAAHSELVKSSEICASCHTVHLPVLHGGKIIGHTYEQATYPEWAFSSYRTGETVDGPLPEGPGTKAQSCQGCHMPNKDARGKTYRSKIATIQEASSFPQAEYTLPAEDIDLEPREGFAKHTLVGLNMFLTKMAQQFPDVLGIRTEDPMLPSRRAVDPLTTTERAMIDQAERTAAIDVSEVGRDGDTLTAKVTGHQQGRPQIPHGRRLPPRLHRVQRGRQGRHGSVGLGSHQRHGRDRRRDRQSHCRRAVVDGRLRRAHRPGCPRAPAPLPGHHQADGSADLPGDAGEPRRRGGPKLRRRTRSRTARSPRASSPSAPR